jgi:hypothetical protein
VSRTVRVGVSWSGAGNVISSNEIYDAPRKFTSNPSFACDSWTCSERLLVFIEIGIIGHGVNMLFEDNDLHDLAKGTSDTGGFYAGRTWSDRGNVVRRNKFRRFYQVEKMAQKTSVNGICKQLAAFACNRHSSSLTQWLDKWYSTLTCV